MVLHNFSIFLPKTYITYIFLVSAWRDPNLPPDWKLLIYFKVYSILKAEKFTSSFIIVMVVVVVRSDHMYLYD